MPTGKLFDEEFLQRLQWLGLLAKRISAASASSGQRRSRRLGDGLEFADHRAYAPGDDLRFIDWPYYARMERLLLRLFHEHSEGAVAVLLDRSASMALGEVCKFDYARRMAAALAYVAMANLDRVNLLPFADGLADGLQTGRNRGKILGVLAFLEGLQAGGTTRLGPAVERYVRRFTQSATVMLLTDAIEAEGDLDRSLAILRQHKDQVILLQVVDAYDASPPMLGPSQVSSVESADRFGLNVNQALLDSYRQRWAEFLRAVEKSCLAHRTVYVQAPTSVPFDRLVLQALRRAGVLQG